MQAKNIIFILQMLTNFIMIYTHLKILLYGKGDHSCRNKK